VTPRSPFQIVLYSWKCSTKSPVAVTSSPLTMTPLRPRFVFQRSVSPDVVAVDLERDAGLADVRAADAEVDVRQRGGIPAAALLGVPVASALADLHEHRRLHGAGVDRDAGDDDPGHVADRERDRAADGGKRRVPRCSPSSRSALATSCPARCRVPNPSWLRPDPHS